MKLFQEEGYAGISMRRLAQESGCTVMTLYKYYARKIDVLRDLWGQVFAELFDELERTASRKQTAHERLQAIALGYVAFWLARRDRYFMVFMSSGVSQSDVSVFVQDDRVLSRFGLFRQTLAKVLGGQADEAELTLKSELLLCALNGIAHNLITISAYPWPDPKRLVQAAVAGVIKA
ncbi:MAG: TetR/AcrR family transcriptional regulator [Alphaproteobacteria bacterium]|nr:TetR/AcrR family transcriptional regulator [Alphaproteobacteria bacterium]